MRFRTAAAAACAAIALPLSPAAAADADVFVVTGSGTTSGGGYAVSGAATSAGTSGQGSYLCSGGMTLPGAAGVGTLALQCGPWTFDCTLVHAGALVAAAACPRTTAFPPGAVYGGLVRVTPVNVNPTTRVVVEIVLARVAT